MQGDPAGGGRDSGGDSDELAPDRRVVALDRPGPVRVTAARVRLNAITASGVKVASANQLSSLRICRMDGTIEDERTYGDDPYPPRG